MENLMTNDMNTFQKWYDISLKENKKFWLKQAERIHWEVPPTKALEGDFTNVNYQWFSDGKLNVSYNCVDRHLATQANKTAIIWAKDKLGEYEFITYKQLSERVNQVANMLRHYGVKKGDRVCLYLPMIPELTYFMLACTRIGAVHSIVFAGFSAQALQGRLVDGQCKLLVTANEGLRGGKTIPLKAIVDEALALPDTSVEKVIVVDRTETKVEMHTPRDINYHEQIKNFSTVAGYEVMNAEDPLFILYTSGSTGKPKGLVHTSGGYLTYAAFTHQHVFDLKPEDIYFCAADIGWITGHSYIVYGPLANGATTVMFESTPTYPDAGRYWQVVDDLKVTIFYTAPTALRAIAALGDEWVQKYKRSSLRVLGSVGEPINPEVWHWYHDIVGEKRCSIVDTWWQTETGGVLISPLANVTQTKAGSATFPLYGIEPVLLEADSGKVLIEQNVSGALCLKHSWPGQARTIYNDHERFVQTYFSQYQGYYFTGDGATRDEDGYYWITGRMDDVLNVSGHRLGTAEIESALITHHDVAEAAVVGYPHDIKGTGVYAYVILNQGVVSSDQLLKEIKGQVAVEIGKFAAPDIIHICTGLPKTRSGKIMRRILRKIAAGEFESLGDISTLADPSVVEQLILNHRENIN